MAETAITHVAPRPALRPAPARTPKPMLSVVIVNFRQWDNTVALTHQLDNSDAMRAGHAEVVLIDNDATGHPLQRCVRHWLGVSLHRFDRNRGFARAVNEGCRRASGDWLLLLNPDVHAPEEFLDAVMTAAEGLIERDSKAGVIGFQLRHADGTRQGSSGPFPTFANVLAGLLRPRSRRRCQPVAGPEPRRVAWVTGCCLLVRRDCWDALGGFDEDFFLYYEDVDLCRRARDAGFSVWYDPTVRVTHFLPLHTRVVTPPLRVMTRHALLTYATKHWTNWQSNVLGGVVFAEATARRLFASLSRDRVAGRHYERLQRLSLDMLRRRFVRARSHLLRSTP